MQEFQHTLITLCPEEFLNSPPLLGDLLPPEKQYPLIVCIVPIDLGAPKGRLILPQVQAIRDALDYEATVRGNFKNSNLIHKNTSRYA